MADITTSSDPTEYDRPQDYNRPAGGIIRVMDRLLKHGMTQPEANKES